MVRGKGNGRRRGAVGFFEGAEHEHEGCAGFDLLAGGPAGVVEALGVAVDHGGGAGNGDVAVFGSGFEQDFADVDEGIERVKGKGGVGGTMRSS